MKFDMKNMTMYLGCIALAVFVVYLCTNMLSLNNKIVEGLISKPNKRKTPEEVLKAIESIKTSLEDTLHIDKYKGTYRKILVGFEDLIHLNTLQQFTEMEELGMGIKPQYMDSIGKMATFGNHLGNVDEFLSSYKSQ
jgi:hypothetical protein